MRACEPPATVEGDCGPAQVQGGSDPGCRPVGHACPEGTPDDEWVLDRVRDAAPDAEVRAVRRVGPGDDVFALSFEDGVAAYLPPGRYEVDVVQPGVGSFIVGACAALVTMAGKGVNLFGGGGLVGLTVEGNVGTKGGVLAGVVVRDSGAAGVFSGQGRTELRDVVIRDCRGAGLVVVNSAEVVARGLTIERVVGVGVTAAIYDQAAADAADPPGGARLDVEDLAVRGTRPRADESGGVALSFIAGATANVRRAVVEGGHGAAIEVFTKAGFGIGEGIATATFEDVFVRDVQRRMNTEFGSGLLAGAGARVRATRLVVDGTQLTGIFAASPFEHRPTWVEAEDVFIRNVVAGRAVAAFGVAFGGFGEMTLRRVVVTKTQGVGVLAGLSNYSGISVLDAEDLLIHDIEVGPGRILGRGMEVKRGARATVRRMRVDTAYEGGVVTLGWGRSPETRVNLSDILVEHIDRAPCALIPADEAFTCRFPDGTDEGGGHGLVAVTGARVDIERFRFAGNSLAGLALARSAEVDARRGVITGNGIGLNIDLDDYDPDRLADDVFVFDNGVDIAREQLPVPTASQLAE